MKSIILMGIKHCGKSTQAKRLSEHFGIDFFDTDDLITEIYKKTPREIYSTQGKDSFLNAEKYACQKLEQILSEKNKSPFNAVIATGGGICNNPDAIDILRKLGILIFLDADEETSFKRILKEISIDEHGSFKNLPAYISEKNPETLEDVKNIFHNFFENREKIYKNICDKTVKCPAVSKEENTASILKVLQNI